MKHLIQGLQLKFANRVSANMVPNHSAFSLIQRMAEISFHMYFFVKNVLFFSVSLFSLFILFLNFIFLISNMTDFMLHSPQHYVDDTYHLSQCCFFYHFQILSMSNTIKEDLIKRFDQLKNQSLSHVLSYDDSSDAASSISTVSLSISLCR